MARATAFRQWRVPSPGVWLGLVLVVSASAGTLARFDTPFGEVEVELLDQDKPVTVSNFIRYVESGRWQDVFAHRLDPGFVVQGGGFRVPQRGTTNQIIDRVDSFGNIPNEFSTGRRFSNVYGTIAMAKLGGNTNSASSEWFINLADNVFLDAANTNSLFTVFGRVRRGTNVLEIFNRFNQSAVSNIVGDARSVHPAFGELPLLRPSLEYTNLVYINVRLLRAEVAATGAGPEIAWDSVSGLTNVVEYSESLPPEWQSLARPLGTGARLRLTDPAPGAFRCYRVRIEYP